MIVARSMKFIFVTYSSQTILTYSQFFSYFYLFMTTAPLWFKCHKQNKLLWIKRAAFLFNFCVRTCRVKSFHYYKTLSSCQQLLLVKALLRIECITMITINAVPQINVTNVFAIFKRSTSLNLTYKKYLFNWFFSLQWK